VHLQVPQPVLEFVLGADVGDRQQDALSGRGQRRDRDLRPFGRFSRRVQRSLASRPRSTSR
jgi:hypothetical protein